MSSYVIGTDRKLWMAKESSFGVPAKFASTDAYRGPDLQIEPEADDAELMEALGSGSTQGFRRGMESGKWSSPCYIEPAAVGTPPDVGPGFESAFGVQTINAGTSVVYTCNDLAKPSLALGYHAGDEFQSAHGAWVEQLDMEIKRNEPAMCTFSGGFALYGSARGGVLLTANSTSGTATITVSVANAAMFRAGGHINFATHAGYLILSVNYATGVITLASNLTANVNTGDTVLAWSPTITTAGTALHGIDCGLTISAVDYGFISAKVSFKTGTHGADKEASSLRPTGAIRGKRTVELEIQCYLLPSVIGPIHAKAWRQSTDAVTVRFGSNVAGQRMKLTMPKVYWKVSPVPVGMNDEAVITLKGTALQNAAAGDEITMTFD